VIEIDMPTCIYFVAFCVLFAGSSMMLAQAPVRCVILRVC
jgi:hypothetical protein